MPKTAVTFCRREDPLEPVCAVGAGAVGRALAMRVRARLSHDGERLSGVVAGDIVLFMGEAARLPWVDGVLYLGRDPRAPRLLLPTQQRPSVPLEAFERAVWRRAAHAAGRSGAPLLHGPIAILLDPERILSVAEARPVDPVALDEFLGRSS